jgi:hypothetical protein
MTEFASTTTPTWSRRELIRWTRSLNRARALASGRFTPARLTTYANRSSPAASSSRLVEEDIQRERRLDGNLHHHEQPVFDPPDSIPELDAFVRRRIGTIWPGFDGHDRAASLTTSTCAVPPAPASSGLELPEGSPTEAATEPHRGLPANLEGEK